jgi:hypothetical protein
MENNKVAIIGDTYPVKDVLKVKFSAKWNADEKAWMVDQIYAEAAQTLVDNGCSKYQVDKAARKLAVRYAQ